MEKIHWLDEVTARKEDLLADLFRLLKIESVRDDALASEEAPVGPGPLKALNEFMQMAEEDGFTTQKFGPWAGRIELGQGDELVGILGHLDVVPAGSGWQTDPFDPVIKDERIYARGSSDDKGPTVAAFFALKLLRELGVEFNKRIHLIVGTDEESGWQCMDYYFKHAEMPDLGFSPDADFPIINGEKGNVSALFSSKNTEEQSGQLELVNWQAGLRPNMVPESAQAQVKLVDTNLSPETLTDAFNHYLDQHQFKGQIDIKDQIADLTLVGKSAHGSTPEKGINAATHLAKFLADYSWTRLDAQQLIQLLSQELFEGFDASKVGVAHHHPVMGDVSMNVGIVNFNLEDGVSMNVNFRFPEGTDPEKMLTQMQDQLTAYTALSFEMGAHKEPHYVPADDPLVATLLDVYHRQTGLPAHEQTIGGGTYGRLMPRGVAYGALFPDSIDTMHQANEFLAVKDLLRATAIYAEAIYELTR
ncbi:dipeptidase PepV [Ignavigranum ruoffiae]|uniref:Peptidase V. Metallo peptidase. MEROPS family M20A n=1 Tax=Ignavigranum ruoffiae TaxID=89093 RepID=A0A1H9A400_9LACT|nr:dipeptidase PepV [Ignavigranum ruoffiae]SEP71241.1 peptidase V. Metallo peptidase. MEROPS family M20A [Ignavigranum ruoffiae]